MQFQALGFSKGPFYVYTFLNIRPLSENTFTWTFCSHNVKFLASPSCHPLANNECCFYDTHQAQLWEFMFLPPGWVTTSLMSCGSKAPGHWGRCVWVGRAFGLTAPNFSLFSPIFFFSFEFAHQACCEEWTIFTWKDSRLQSTGGPPGQAPILFLFEKMVSWKRMPGRADTRKKLESCTWALGHCAHPGCLLRTSQHPGAKQGEKHKLGQHGCYECLLASADCFEDAKHYGALSTKIINYKSSRSSLEN